MPLPITIDPAVFDSQAIAPETTATNDKLEAFFKTIPPIWDVGATVIRAARRNGEGMLGREPEADIAQWRTISANGQTVRVRIFTPETITGIYLHIHGGGHTIGSADNQDQTLAHFANTLNMAIVSVEYRLAPENIWPAAPDDCETAAVWLAQNAQTEFGTDRMLVGGESAGAHLALVTLLRMRDRHGFTGFCGANLVYGVYDMALSPSARQWGERNLILSTPIIEWFMENLLPATAFSETDKRAPEISPLYAALHDLPPALFTVGTLDPLVDDTLMMAARWVGAGNSADLRIYPGGIHAFDILDIPIAREARASMIEFMGQCLG
ncbi:MAG: alpha/beta hydrolase [Pseudomonadota bacterium]